MAADEILDGDNDKMKRLVEAAHKIYEEMKEKHAEQMGCLESRKSFVPIWYV